MNRIFTILLCMTCMVAASAQPEGVISSNNGGKTQNSEARAENNKKKGDSDVKEAGRMYVYGVAISPADSVVYMTDELILENAQTYKKTDFLYGRDMLSKQLYEHLAQKGEKNRICSVTFSKKLKDIDKKYAKQVKALKKQGYLVKSVGQGEFRFTTVRTE